MVIEEVRKNKSAKRPNFHKGSLSHSPSQTNGDAKVQINSEIAIPKLQKLAETYFGVSDPHRFLTDLRVALGIPDSQGASKYGVVSIPKEDGSILQASLRVTNHQANANTYIDHDANYKYNLSIVVRRKQRKNTFIPNENVILDEYVYYGTKMQNVENPLTQIVNGIIVFLQSGEYKDTTGIAFKNQSVESKDRVPQNISVDNDGNYVSANAWGADYVSENKQYKTNTNMNKKLIKLTESDLHRIVKETVNRILKEDDSTPNIFNNRSMFANFIYQTSSKMRGIKESLFYDVLNGGINQFKILSNEEKDELVKIAEMANNLDRHMAYLSEMFESQSSPQFEDEPEDWYERNEHGDFDTY